MTKIGNNAVPQSDEAVERLLAQAPPRPTPPAEIKAQAKLAVEAEWRRVTQRRRRIWTFAAAASVVALAIALMTLLSGPDVTPIQVATIDKSNGTISLLGEQGLLQDARNLQVVQSGQTMVTDSDSGLGLSWGRGGSLRLDANTTVSFVAADQIELRSGRVYFDSGSDTLSEESLLIHTDFGDVRHVGTQFMAEVGNTDLLKVSVREGKVFIDGLNQTIDAEAGKQVVLHGDRAPSVTSLAAHGGEWAWVEAIAPMVSMKGKTFYQLVEWVKRETGLDFHFATSAAKAAAQGPSALLIGVVGSEPQILLKHGAHITGFEYQLINGVIVISQSEL